MFASDIKDIVVYSKDMVNLGKVKDLEFDPSEMKVTNIILEFQKEAAKEVLVKMIVLRHAKGRVPATSIEKHQGCSQPEVAFDGVEGRVQKPIDRNS